MSAVTSEEVEKIGHYTLWLLSKENLIDENGQYEVWSDWDPNVSEIHSCWTIRIPLKLYEDSLDTNILVIHFYIKNSKIAVDFKYSTNSLQGEAMKAYNPARKDENQLYTSDDYREALVNKIKTSYEIQYIKGMIKGLTFVIENRYSLISSEDSCAYDDSTTYKSLDDLESNVVSDLEKLGSSTKTEDVVNQTACENMQEPKNSSCDDKISLDDSLSPEPEATSASNAVQSDEDYQEAYNKHAERLRNRVRKAAQEICEVKDDTDSRDSSKTDGKSISAPKMQQLQVDEKYFNKDILNQEMKDMKVKRYADHKLSRRDLVTGIVASAASNILDSQNAFDGCTPTGEYDDVLSAAFADTKQAFNDDSKFILKHENNGDNLYLASNHEKLITEVDEQLDKTERYQIEPAFALYLTSLPDWQNIAGSKFDQAVSHYLDEQSSQNKQDEFMRKQDETVARLLNDNLPNDVDEDTEKESNSKKKTKR